MLFALVCLGAYLNKIGLPDFVKRPLLANLRSHGVDLEFSRLRLRGYRGIVADDVRLAGMDNPAMPTFHANSADVKLDYAALARLRLDIQGVTLNQGTVRWQLSTTNEPLQEIVITNIMANLRLLPGDQWTLDRLDAVFMGARFSVSGHVTNATALASLMQAREQKPPGAFSSKLRRVQQQLENVHFRQPPRFQLTFQGDGRNLSSFVGQFTIDAPDANTPWGDLVNAQLIAHLDGRVLTDTVAARIKLTAAHVDTEWTSVEQLSLESTASQVSTNEVECEARISTGRVYGDWANADTLNLQADWRHRPHELQPYAAHIRLHTSELSTRWGSAGDVELSVNARPASDWLAMNDPALGPWNQLLPYALNLSIAATNATARDLQAEALGLTARWDAPHLVVSNAHGHLAGGQAQLQAALDVLTRKLKFDGCANLDFHQFNPVLTEKGRVWLDNFTWGEAPAVAMRGSLTLPAWTNQTPDWRGEMQPSIVLDGNVVLTNGSYRGISVLSAQTGLNYSNRVWHLPDLTLHRSEGTLQVDLRSDEVSHDYAIKLRGPFDPRVLASQLDEKGQRGLGYFEISDAPWLDAEVRGRWYERERTYAQAKIVWTNVSYRAQRVDRLSASLEYSNQVLQVTQLRADRGDRFAMADGIRFDFAAHKAYLTNGYSTLDPMLIAHAIGPKTAAAVEPYQFLEPPVARVHGIIPLQGERDADLHFDLAGGPFHWSKFRVPTIAGQVHWANERVVLTNTVTTFYGGEAHGHAWFDVSQRGSTPFRFALNVTNSDLNALMADLHSPTNQLEGLLTGELVVTDANTTNWNSWNGYGQATLRNGLIWDSPIFGVMSFVMNTVIPGIGNSRASEAGGSFTITNSLIHTRDLDIRASGMRLRYNGTVDFQTRVNARVEAELLRDTWFVGKLVSTALWPVSKLFEYQVTGTLAAPKPEPVYLVPKLFLAPLHPVKSFKEMIQKPEKSYEALPDYLLTPSGQDIAPAAPGTETTSPAPDAP